MPTREKSKLKHHVSHHEGSNCEFCREFKEFVLPDHLLDALSQGNVVVFAGAGISTESRTVFPWTFYEQIHKALDLREDERPIFPDLMSRYCAQPDGRRKLLETIHNRFAYVDAFPELYRVATRFHQELSTFFNIDTYITTNWDNYFERECGAAPFVTAEDFALWNVPGRKVFKIHGSVSSFGSILTTAEDYAHARTQLEKGALGSALKLMLATKTVVYVGYSFGDDDFLSIQAYLSEELRQVSPAAYIVTIDRDSEARFRALGLLPIFTDATYFFSVLKKHLATEGHFLPDDRLSGTVPALMHARSEHVRLMRTYKPHENPESIYAAFYQDGLKHAFERILAMKHTGQYSHRCNIIEQVRRYEKIRADNLKRTRYLDVAYIDGYMNGMIFLLLNDEERKDLPYYYVYGVKEQPRTLDAYKAAVKNLKSHHKSALRLARRMFSDRLGIRDVPHHRPFLDWSVPL
jgi:hypothetical protein